jgi:hypothetical protein
VLVPDHSVLGKYALCAAALSIVSIAASPIAAADVATNLTRAADAIQPIARAAHLISSPAGHALHSSSVKHPLALEVPRHADFGMPDSQRIATAAAGAEGRFTASFPIRWQREEPQVFRTARLFRRQGLPLVHLWQSESGEHLLSIGLNSHGVPGIWLTQKIPD